MKKIMFNEPYGLQNAVLIGSKRMTRRDELNLSKKHTEEEIDFINILNNENIDYKIIFDHINTFTINCDDGLEHSLKSRYKVGEIVAIAQSYSQIKKEKGFDENFISYLYYSSEAGENNKMFVSARLMIHHIKITEIKIERLQDISDEDCIKEGIDKTPFDAGFWHNNIRCCFCFFTPREAFASLINKISGKGYWESNPFVVVYSFKLIS